MQQTLGLLSNILVWLSRHLIFMLRPKVIRLSIRRLNFLSMLINKKAYSCVCMKSCFLPSHSCLTPPSRGTPCDINAIYRSLKSTFSELQIRRWQYGSVFIRLAVIASETQEMSRNSKRIWPYSSSRSSKVINLGVNGKPTRDFLLVINCNFSHICYRFRDIHA